YIGIGGRLALHKARLEVGLGAIQIDALQEDTVEMKIQIDRTAKTLDKGHRPRLNLGPWDTACDRLVHIILPNRGADDGMNLRGELLGRSHPIPQADRHRYDPLARRHPGDDLLDEVGGGLGHAPPGTGGAKPAPLAAESEQELFMAGVTAQP